MTGLPTPHCASAERFAALRDFLAESGYAESAILDRMGIRALSQSLKMHAGAPPDDRLDALIQIFLLGRTLPTSGLIPADAIDLFGALGLGVNDSSGFTASVELYPSRGLYLISDRNRGDELPPGQDKVFSAITPNTEEFLAMLPHGPCPSLLELCSGAGLAALEAARDYAVQTFAYDLSPRSRLFADFNRRLNGIANMSAEQGDLYQPAGRRTFDRIVAHPPYVPSLRATEMLRDGGEIGEDLTRRIVAGLPTYLYPGGRLYCLALLAETAGEAVPDRIRRWLREREREFDVVVVTRRRMEPARVIFDNWPVRHAQPGDVERWQAILKQRRIEAFVYVTIVIERHAEPRQALTVARDAGETYSVSAVEALLARAPLTGARPVANATLTMESHALAVLGAWREDSRVFTVSEPFRFRYQGPPWLADWLPRCDGTRPLDESRPAGVDLHEFERVIADLVSGGVLRL